MIPTTQEIAQQYEAAAALPHHPNLARAAAVWAKSQREKLSAVAGDGADGAYHLYEVAAAATQTAPSIPTQRAAAAAEAAAWAAYEALAGGVE